jgi:hypothetical protein
MCRFLLDNIISNQQMWKSAVVFLVKELFKSISTSHLSQMKTTSRKFRIEHYAEL